MFILHCAMFFDTRARRTISLITLIAANLGVLIAVLLDKIEVRQVLVLYWAESAIIGVFTILKILTASAMDEQQIDGDGESTPSIRQSRDGFAVVRRLFLSAFFCVHFGGFMFVHAMFLTAFFSMGTSLSSMHGGPLGGLSALIETLEPVRLGVVGLFVSHAISFVVHWWIGGERHDVDASRVFASPYKRIIVMHVTIVLGGFAIALLGAPLALVAILVIIKTVIDAVAHTREHRLQGE
ncbi:MAG: hypothetical protein KDC95_04570 [Planctomycetes bacterium]|nr:hypothetical protein [Planctomycetota bacterium]